MDRSMELRKLPPAALFKLGQILDSGNAWKQIMAIIPNDPTDLNSSAKYSVEHIKLIESAGEKQSRSCSEILFDEWGTSGKVRPDLDILLKILIKAQLYRAADYVATQLLKENPPERPADGPAASVNLNLPPSLPDNGNLTNISHLPYSLLQVITNNFDEMPLKKFASHGGSSLYIGHKLGTGAFGTVFFGELENGRKVAVKKLSTNAINLVHQFENEIETLSKYQHKNLVPLLGFSCDTPNYCLIYEFMANGSLLDRLQVKKKSSSWLNNETNEVLNGVASNLESQSIEPLPWQKRMEIAIDTCRGIHFLHTSGDMPLIHRDIKTANILLDDHLIARLGDFGLVKVKPNRSESKMLTSTVFGTSAYMAPEAFRGDVSVKMDVFSVGVVLLELLTGLPPFDESREGCDLVTFIEEKVEDSIEFLLDGSAGEWDVPLAQEIFTLSQDCLEEKRKRPLIIEVLEKLQTLHNNVSIV